MARLSAHATVSLAVVPVVAVVGITASGKSALGVQLAQALGGEVVNGDSMQIYRGMDIGTAKLTRAERRGVPHHLLDMLAVTEPSTVQQFQGWARTAIDDCRTRGRPPILVGGSALYVRAVLDRFEFPPTEPRLRARLDDELTRHGPSALHARLRALDPAAADAISTSNGRRIVRALEVVQLTGGPFRARLPPLEHAVDGVVQVGLAVPRDVVDARIASRVEAMFGAGLVDEVRSLEQAGLRTGRTASRALGYAQVLSHLDGTCSLEEAGAATVRATRRFARRQESWFRRDPRIHWLGADSPDLLPRVLDAVRSGA